MPSVQGTEMLWHCGSHNTSVRLTSGNFYEIKGERML